MLITATKFHPTMFGIVLIDVSLIAVKVAIQVTVVRVVVGAVVFDAV